MIEPDRSENEDLFEKALDLADKHLEIAVQEGLPLGLGAYVPIAMIEAAVNQAVEQAGQEDIAEMLRDLAEQIENDDDEEEEEA